jgi:hypothetical protein
MLGGLSYVLIRPDTRNHCQDDGLVASPSIDRENILQELGPVDPESLVYDQEVMG